MALRADVVILILIAGFCATNFWRFGGGILGAKLNENSAFFRWVKLVATALIASLVAKLSLYPTGNLAEIAFILRASGIGVALLVFFVTLRKYSYNIALGLGVMSGVLWLLLLRDIHLL